MWSTELKPQDGLPNAASFRQWTHVWVGRLVTVQTSAGIIYAGCTELLEVAAKMADRSGVFTSIWALMPVLDNLNDKNSSRCSGWVVFKFKQVAYTCLFPWVCSCVGCYRAAWMTDSKAAFPWVWQFIPSHMKNTRKLLGFLKQQHTVVENKMWPVAGKWNPLWTNN